MHKKFDYSFNSDPNRDQQMNTKVTNIQGVKILI